MFEHELKVTRRLFLQHSAGTTAMSAAAYGIALKTDALARAKDDGVILRSEHDDILPYVYHEGSQ